MHTSTSDDVNAIQYHQVTCAFVAHIQYCAHAQPSIRAAIISGHGNAMNKKVAPLPLQLQGFTPTEALITLKPGGAAELPFWQLMCNAFCCGFATFAAALMVIKLPADDHERVFVTVFWISRFSSEERHFLVAVRAVRSE